MEINIIIFINLLAYSIIVSQSFSYIIALTDVQKKLSAASYIELRKLLDTNFRKKFGIVVYTTLISSTLLTVFSAMNPTCLLFISSVIGLAALIIDILLMLKGNMPINNMINTWTSENHPADWKSYRAKWLSIFEKRQIANIIGFISILIGAVFG